MNFIELPENNALGYEIAYYMLLGIKTMYSGPSL